MWPQPQVGENFLDDLALVNEGDEAHRAPTPLTQQGIGRIHFLNQLGPARREEAISRLAGYATLPSPLPSQWKGSNINSTNQRLDPFGE